MCRLTSDSAVPDMAASMLLTRSAATRAALSTLI